MYAKFEGLVEVGERIRAYDYNPLLMGGKKVYLEGKVISIVEKPYKAYRVMCDKCNFFGREGQKVLVPMEIAVAEFDDRVVKIKD
tara:strand:- start:2131 stop:2385 length:255 start_codon:yes stop_codon:yes gene_type:complete